MTVRGQQRVFDDVAQQLGARQLARVEMTPFAEQAPGFVFIGTIRELSATILLTTANTKLVSVIIYDLNESGDMGAISVLGIMLLVVSFAVVVLANRLPLLGGPRLPALR